MTNLVEIGIQPFHKVVAAVDHVFVDSKVPKRSGGDFWRVTGRPTRKAEFWRPLLRDHPLSNNDCDTHT